VKLDLEGTEFQRKAWQAMRKIPFGETISYGEQARKVGKPKAYRAVGSANGKNPIPIIVPCHRVLASDGSLGGYSLGLPMKRRLLALEGVSVAG
jgi:methylated-DNA-[protein]-cysteine S-methyltransferase